MAEDKPVERRDGLVQALFQVAGNVDAPISIREAVDIAQNALETYYLSQPCTNCEHRLKDHGPTEDYPNYGDPAPCSECACNSFFALESRAAAWKALADEAIRALEVLRPHDFRALQARYSALKKQEGR